MTTAAQLIEGAAEEIGVKTAESELEAEDYQMILDRLNDLGFEWADSGLTPAFIEVANRDDIVNIDNNARAAFKFTLAIRIAPAFERIVTPALAANADTALQRLQASVVFIGDVAYPDTLPEGSGNDCLTDTRFFPQNQKESF
jgi:hypothetical protein